VRNRRAAGTGRFCLGTAVILHALVSALVSARSARVAPRARCFFRDGRGI
jgi:hypothetical protein